MCRYLIRLRRRRHHFHYHHGYDLYDILSLTQVNSSKVTHTHTHTHTKKKHPKFKISKHYHHHQINHIFFGKPKLNLFFRANFSKKSTWYVFYEKVFLCGSKMMMKEWHDRHQIQMTLKETTVEKNLIIIFVMWNKRTKKMHWK